MIDAGFDLGGPVVWVAALALLFFYVPLTSGRARRAVLAAVNAGVLGALLGERALLVGAALVLVWLSLRARSGLYLLGAATLALFVLRKLPMVPGAQAVLVTIGFSYVALRVVELIAELRSGEHAPPDVLTLLNYLLPFHMLAAGPILAYHAHAEAPAVPPRASASAVYEGASLVVSGLLKKFVLAAWIEATFLTGFTSHGWLFALEIQLYYVWFYLDFSSYSDVALGLGRVLELPTPRNFDRPLTARNLTQFWERWHISLSELIRRRLFIPIQVGLMRREVGQLGAAIAAFLVSFLLCGLWHGLALPFLAWGGMHAIGLAASHAFRELAKRRLGPARLRAIGERRWVRALTTVMTFEYVALSLLIVGYPWGAR